LCEAKNISLYFFIHEAVTLTIFAAKMSVLKSLTMLFIVLALISSCGSKDNTNEEVVPPMEVEKFEVKYAGALKTMMHEGDISAKIELSQFVDRKHFYALGAFENLKGEIQIFDGESYSTYVKDSSLSMDKSFDKKATLLVYATVQRWNSFIIPDTVVKYEQLEAFVNQTAVENRINVDEPFPFLIEGNAASFDWHVINWKDGDTEHSHEKHVNAGLNGTLEDKDVDLLGFYSNAHHGVFTHHTTNMHIHARTKIGGIAGHVDELTLGGKMILKLPFVQE
jgi:hypothetical protein